MLPSNWYGNSVCNGCEYGERISCGVFCDEIKELVPVGYQGCKAQDDFYKKKESMTLTKFAQWLRKIVRFNYLTYNQYGILVIWIGERPKPELTRDFCFWNFYPERTFSVGSIDTKTKDCVDLDLSEYKNENGEIDYSRCIVEVTDASE